MKKHKNDKPKRKLGLTTESLRWLVDARELNSVAGGKKGTTTDMHVQFPGG